MGKTKSRRILLKDKRAIVKTSIISVLFLLITVFILLSHNGIISAAGSGNAVNNASVNAIIIKNSTGSAIADLNLVTPHINQVMRGSNVLVAEFNLTNYNSYMSPVGNISFYDLSNNNKILNRKFTYKYLILNGTNKIPTYYTDCSMKDINGTNYCKQIQNGTITQDRYDWSNFAPAAIMNPKNITIGIFTDVLPNDYVEWIPTIYGMNITQWAVWNDSFNVNLTAYYGFDENTGTNSREYILGRNNATVNFGSWITGKNSSAIKYNGATTQVVFNNNSMFRQTNIGNPITINFWGNLSSNPTDQSYIVLESNDTLSKGGLIIYKGNGYGFRFGIGPSWGIHTFILRYDNEISGEFDSGLYKMYTFVWDGLKDSSSARIYVNGIEASYTDTFFWNDQNNNSILWTNQEMELGSSPAYYNVGPNGAIDELSIWTGRNLSLSEIQSLYNSDSGIFYQPSGEGSPSDTSYPQFSNYYDNNASYAGKGNITLNVTVTSTNGTVWATFNNSIYYASNNSGNATTFNVTILNYGNGTFIYNWSSYGNGSSMNLNSSQNFYYTINNTPFVDTTQPYFVNNTPINQTISYGTVESQYVNASDNIGISCFNINDTHFSINCTGYMKNITAIGVGTYWINVSVNDTSNNLNSSIFYVNVTQISASLGITKTSPITYPATTDFTGTGCPAQLSCTLNLTNQIFPAITIWANYSTIGNSNYTQASVVNSITINKAIPTFSYFINSQINNISIVYNTSKINATLTTNAGVPVIYRGGINVSNENGLNVDLPVGNYSYLFNITGNQNYSDVSPINISVNLTQATGIVYTYVNGTRANITINTTSSIWINSTLIAGQGNISLYVNLSQINTGASPIQNYTLFNDTFVYNITAIYPGNINYTFAFENWWVNATNVTISITPPSSGSGGGGGCSYYPSLNITGNNQTKQKNNFFNLTQTGEVVINTIADPANRNYVVAGIIAFFLIIFVAIAISRNRFLKRIRKEIGGKKKHGRKKD